MVFGEYEVDSPQEWELLVCNLMALQLGALKRLMTRLKASAEAVRCESVYMKAVEAENRVAQLVERLHVGSLGALRTNIT